MMLKDDDDDDDDDDGDGDDGDHRCYSHGCHQRHGLSWLSIKVMAICGWCVDDDDDDGDNNDAGMMVMMLMMMAMMMRMVMTMMHVLIHLSAESSCNPPNPMLGEEFYVLNKKTTFSSMARFHDMFWCVVSRFSSSIFVSYWRYLRICIFSYLVLMAVGLCCRTPFPLLFTSMVPNTIHPFSPLPSLQILSSS